MAMAMPAWQCMPWLQYSQMGSVVLTIMLNNMAPSSGPETGMKPEKMAAVLPLLSGMHGELKDD